VELGRAARGGSWNNNQDNARCAYRNRNNPNNLNNNIGFRVVCARSHVLPPFSLACALVAQAGGIPAIGCSLPAMRRAATGRPAAEVKEKNSAGRSGPRLIVGIGAGRISKRGMAWSLSRHARRFV